MTVTLDGKIHAFRTSDGGEAWTQQLPASSNSTPAIAGDMTVQGAGYPAAAGQNPQVVAYRLPQA